MNFGNLKKFRITILTAVMLFSSASAFADRFGWGQHDHGGWHGGGHHGPGEPGHGGPGWPNEPGGPGHGDQDHGRWDTIRILSATYGANCRVRYGNATNSVARWCERYEDCQYRIDTRELGDPAYGCAKDFRVEYQCGNDSPQEVYVRPEANGQVAELYCSRRTNNGIQVTEATYGRNCGTQINNVYSPIARNCDGQRNCSYQVSHHVLGDPAPGCAKDFVVRYECYFHGRYMGQNTAALAPEASGQYLNLYCR